MKTVNGWTILRHEKDLKRFRKQASNSYLSNPPEFPCLIQSQISADENGFEVFCTASNLRNMLDAITKAKATP